LASTRSFAAERGIGVLMILHDLNLAAQYSDRVLVLLGVHTRRRRAFGRAAYLLSRMAPEHFELVAASPDAAELCAMGGSGITI